MEPEKHSCKSADGKLAPNKRREYEFQKIKRRTKFILANAREGFYKLYRKVRQYIYKLHRKIGKRIHQLPSAAGIGERRYLLHTQIRQEGNRFYAKIGKMFHLGNELKKTKRTGI